MTLGETRMKKANVNADAASDQTTQRLACATVDVPVSDKAARTRGVADGAGDVPAAATITHSHGAEKAVSR